eukprot:m.47944 g.47944  ORF g.47944 m.47944 type:complete len:351 (+) comp6942_c0_seq2:151-1203(+)
MYTLSSTRLMMATGNYPCRSQVSIIRCHRWRVMVVALVVSALPCCPSQTCTNREYLTGAVSHDLLEGGAVTATTDKTCTRHTRTDSTDTHQGDTSTTQRTIGLNSGGWRLPPRHHRTLDAGTVCNMNRLAHASWLQRMDDTDGRYEPHEPVIITMPVMRQARFRDICHRTELLRRFGHKNVTLASANSHSYDKRSVLFETYVNSMLEPMDLSAVARDTFYLFGDNDYNDWVNFTDHYARPVWGYPDRDPFFSFGVGGSGSGVPFHTHGAVFAEVLWGRKRWFATSPDNRPNFSPHNTSLDWVTNVLPHTDRSSIGLLDCTLGPGEILWLPAQWWHATLNIGDTVFMSTFV